MYNPDILNFDLMDEILLLLDHRLTIYKLFFDDNIKPVLHN